MAIEFDRECWRVSGPLTVAEVPDRYAASLSRRDGEGLPEAVDLAAVERTDSSALALLLEWSSWAHKAGRELEFRDPPRSLRVIAGLSDASGLLGWPGESKTASGERHA